MGMEEHRRKGPSRVKCAVIVTSDTRDVQTDKSGNLIADLLKNAGHEVISYMIVRNDPGSLRKALDEVKEDSQAVIVSGGTGISRRDITVDTIEPLLERELSGFGELFRYLSYGEIGPAALLSRAVAGTVGSKIVFCLPGSAGAVKLAVEKLILPELSHIIGELEK